MHSGLVLTFTVFGKTITGSEDRMEKYLLEMKNISKSFGTNRVLEKIDINVKAGEVLALLGENGAGKSTLIKILGGIYSRDEGEIYINGEKIEIHSVMDAQKNGIRIIHQEIVLVPERSVATNIFMGREPRTKAGFVDYRKMEEETEQIIKKFGLSILPDELVSGLTIGMQQMVEIMRAVSANAKIVVMDEPTSSLSEHETEILFGIINQLRNMNVGIIYISHRMNEIFQIAERVTVLRDGKKICTVETEKSNKEELINQMVGRTLTKYYIKTKNEIKQKSLEVKNLESKNLFHNISFYGRYGEIVGFSGLVGAKRTEVMKTVFGIIPFNEGTVYMDGKPVTIKNPKDALEAGIAYIPENRREEGLVLLNTVGFNMTLVALRFLIRGITCDYKKKKEIIDGFIDKLSIKVTSKEQLAGNLSGGNQQKVVLAKWLANNPKVLILDEPTRGIDVGSKAEIYGIINELAAHGISVIMVSSELPEIINMCDRVYIMCEGRITGELTSNELSQEKVMMLSSTHFTNREEES